MTLDEQRELIQLCRALVRRDGLRRDTWEGYEFYDLVASGYRIYYIPQIPTLTLSVHDLGLPVMEILDDYWHSERWYSFSEGKKALEEFRRLMLLETLADL